MELEPHVAAIYEVKIKKGMERMMVLHEIRKNEHWRLMIQNFPKQFPDALPCGDQYVSHFCFACLHFS